MFKVSNGDFFWLPATVVSNGDNGATHKEKVEFRVKRQDAETIGDFRNLLVASQLPEAAQCVDLFVDWKGFADEEGQPLECNDDNKIAALKLWDVRFAFVQAYVTASTKGRGKN